MITFGYEATGPASKDVFVYTVDKAGRIKREVRFQVPYVSVMHDIALTQKHIIFPFACYVTSPEILAVCPQTVYCMRKKSIIRKGFLSLTKKKAE